MEIIGTVKQILEKKTGISSRGNWSRQEIVVETLDDYPKAILLQSFGDKVDFEKLTKGEISKFHVNVESKEFNEKWFTNITVWRIEAIEDSESNVVETRSSEIPY